MHIQINTGSDVPTDGSLDADIEAAVRHALKHFDERITRVEVHLSDVNAEKGGRDTRCVLEARVAGMQPIAVDETSHSSREAVRSAAGKLQRALDSRFGRTGRR